VRLSCVFVGRSGRAAGGGAGAAAVNGHLPLAARPICDAADGIRDCTRRICEFINHLWKREVALSKCDDGLQKLDNGIWKLAVRLPKLADGVQKLVVHLSKLAIPLLE
jgi:X-X-X-Leu-X-X-Gly heptad repeat protein